MFGIRSALPLRHLMSFSDALKITRQSHTKKEIEVFIRPIGRKVILRGGTTDISCFKKIFLEEQYQSPFQSSHPRLIVDAGANIGMASLYFAAKYPRSTIVAIEPELNNFRMLERNCTGVSNIVLKHAALWPVKARLSLKNHDRNEAWTFFASSDPGDIETVTVDDILSEFGANNIDVLKLDIEGGERELFKNAAWLNNINQIIIELHDRYLPGCSNAFYSAIAPISFRQELRGENIFISFVR
jgi:FkbM family methyltransferase